MFQLLLSQGQEELKGFQAGNSSNGNSAGRASKEFFKLTAKPVSVPHPQLCSLTRLAH